MTEVLEERATEAEKEERRKAREKQIKLSQEQAMKALIRRGAKPFSEIIQDTKFLSKDEKPSPKFEDYLYIDHPKDGKRDIYAPDGQGGYYIRNRFHILR